GHGEAVVAGGGPAIGLEGLLPGRDVDDAVPLHRVGGAEDRLEMAAMEGIEGSAADRYVHTGAGASSGARRAPLPSRTILASVRTSLRTCSPVTAEISWYSKPFRSAYSRSFSELPGTAESSFEPQTMRGFLASVSE